MGLTTRNIYKIPTSPTQVLSLHYFLYFGIMGIFLPFFNLFCHHLGLTGFQIGAINALRTIVMVLFALFWGALADRLAIRRHIYVAATFFSAAAWSLYLFTDDFYPMLAVTVLYAIFFGPVIPFLEAFTMEALSGGSNQSQYGRIRAWGSFSFIAVVLIMGVALDHVSSRIIVPLILLGSLIMAVASFLIPERLSPATKSRTGDLKALLTSRVGLFLLANFLMLASHGTYYGFYSIHLEELGYSASFIALAWGLATLAEVGVMLNSERIFKKIPTETALILSFGVATLRWMMLFLFTSKAAILIGQLLHASTYALFHIACILYMDRLSTPANRTLAQVTNNAVSYGLGLMVGFLVNGLLYSHMGSALFLASAGVSVLGAMVMLRGFAADG